MTIGDKIQLYRKELGMSQEELGQKLFVSRQTVSLWENGQTQPTIDNLIRLKEIFGVSVDEILNTEDTVREDPPVPKESYAFNFSANEFSETIQFQKKILIKKAVLFSLFYIAILILSIWKSENYITIGFVAGLLLTGSALNIKGIIACKKTWKKSRERIIKNFYEYKIYDDYFIINIQRNNETIRTYKCYFTDIEQIQDVGKYFLIQISGQLFIIKKSELINDSAFYTYQKNSAEKMTMKSPVGKYKTLSSALFTGSLLSIFGAIFLVAAITEINHMFTANMWIFFLLTPITIASVVFGFILKSKGLKYKKNIIAGIIMTVVLCVSGSFSFVFSDSFDYSDEPILRAEQYIGIDIPDSKQIVTTDWTQKEQSFPSEYIYYHSDIHFEPEATEFFEKEIANDDKWLSSVPNDMIGITSYLNNPQYYDYVLIYNIDTKEFNTLPYESGTYRFINILYKTQTDDMNIIEYNIDYIK